MVRHGIVRTMRRISWRRAIWLASISMKGFAILLGAEATVVSALALLVATGEGEAPLSAGAPLVLAVPVFALP